MVSLRSPCHAHNGWGSGETPVMTWGAGQNRLLFLWKRCHRRQLLPCSRILIGAVKWNYYSRELLEPGIGPA